MTWNDFRNQDRCKIMNKLSTFEKSNLKAIATAADPKLGQNWVKIERKSVCQICIKTVWDFFKKVLENPGA